MCASYPPSLCPSPPNNSSSPPMNAAWCLEGKWTFALAWGLQEIKMITCNVILCNTPLSSPTVPHLVQSAMLRTWSLRNEPEVTSRDQNCLQLAILARNCCHKSCLSWQDLYTNQLVMCKSHASKCVHRAVKHKPFYLQRHFIAMNNGCTLAPLSLEVWRILLQTYTFVHFLQYTTPPYILPAYL